MADVEAPKKGGWFKALIGTAAGLMSGAFMMYASPLLDKVIKPAKPLANFAVDLQGLTVQFHNRSTSACNGWWDFGDGSPLEPVNAQQESITHAYAKAGTYTVKLSLSNILNEESDRTVTINLDSTAAVAAETPAIVSLDAVPVSPGSYAPATYRLRCKTKSAGMCVWNCDANQLMEVVNNPPSDQDRLVTFSQAGSYTVKLVAINGQQFTQGNLNIQVQAPPAGTVTAYLLVTEQMTKVEQAERPVTVSELFSAPSGDVQPINRRIPAALGLEIAGARLDPVTAGRARNLQLTVAPDRRSVLLTGELLREPAGLLHKNHPASPLAMTAHLTEQRRTPVARPSMPVTTTLSVPGSSIVSLPPTPCNCTDHKRQLALELRVGSQVIWKDARLPSNVPVIIGSHRCILTATPVGDQVRIDLVESGRLSAN